MNMTPSTSSTPISRASFNYHATPQRPSFDGIENDWSPDLPAQNIPSRNTEVTLLRKELETLREEVHSLRQQVVVKEKQSKKLPPELSIKVKNLHNNLENQFQPSQSYRSSHNQEVVRELCDQLLQNDTLRTDKATVKRAVYRFYESRRKAYNDSQPRRQLIALENKKKSRKSQEKKRLFDRRAKVVKESERRVWNLLTPLYMSDESDGEDSTKIRHTPNWRSPKLNDYLHKLDFRVKSKLGSCVSRCAKRTYGTPRAALAPTTLPNWMIKESQVPVDQCPGNIYSTGAENDCPGFQDSRHPSTFSYENMYTFPTGSGRQDSFQD